MEFFLWIMAIIWAIYTVFGTYKGEPLEPKYVQINGLITLLYFIFYFIVLWKN